MLAPILYSLFITLINGYSFETAFNCVYLSGAAYCGKSNYSTMCVSGPASGFIQAETLYDIASDLEGYIGYNNAHKSIYVVLRGTSSTLNWMEDLEIKQVPYDTWPECDCEVHKGFYTSILGVKSETIETVKALSQQYPTYNIITTGHSYGAACAQLLAMELQAVVLNTTVYNYGQPRIGDEKYASFSNAKLDKYYRFTHNKDVVPHVPFEFEYAHSCQEIFEDMNGELIECSLDNCEDPIGAIQYAITETNTQDHLYYLKHYMDCSSSTC